LVVIIIIMLGTHVAGSAILLTLKQANYPRGLAHSHEECCRCFIGKRLPKTDFSMTIVWANNPWS